MCRRAVKLLKLDPGSVALSSDALPIHGSVAAVAAWRYAQLLTALPRRETEALAWQRVAEHQWDSLQGWLEIGKLPQQQVLGPLDTLKGGTGESRGVVLDFRLLRALPLV